MSCSLSRRQFLLHMGAFAAGASRSASASGHARRGSSLKRTISADPLTLAGSTDEIAQDFSHALDVAAREFGGGFVELRELWGKNLFALAAAQLDEARSLLKRFNLRVSSI